MRIDIYLCVCVCVDLEGHTALHKATFHNHIEMIEFLLYCYEDKISPHSIVGSYAGAFGYGQFIPSSYNAYAIDGNDDGIRKPYDWYDVFASIGNYLVKNGYPVVDPTNQEKIYKSVYAYNHADNYVKAVLELRKELEKSIIKD